MGKSKWTELYIHVRVFVLVKLRVYIFTRSRRSEFALQFLATEYLCKEDIPIIAISHKERRATN